MSAIKRVLSRLQIQIKGHTLSGLIFQRVDVISIANENKFVSFSFSYINNGFRIESYKYNIVITKIRTKRSERHFMNFRCTCPLGKGRPQYVLFGRDVERTNNFGPICKLSGRPFTSRRPQDVIRTSDLDATSMRRLFYVCD